VRSLTAGGTDSAEKKDSWLTSTTVSARTTMHAAARRVEGPGNQAQPGRRRTPPHGVLRSRAIKQREPPDRTR
jgi:hypothetical protein